jgi:hypothetical protein
MKRGTRKNRRSRRKTRKQKGGDGFNNRRTIRISPLVNDYLDVDDLPVMRRV